MYFQHSPDIWREFPDLVPGVLFASGITIDVDPSPRLQPFLDIATSRLEEKTESELPEIQAWRRTFSKMGLKPTQYRCASEALLRRFRKEGDLPRIHPMIDLCNAISIAFAIPVAAIDVSNVDLFLEVRHATGDENYQTFGGEIEHPEPGEVIFADASGNAHARRWTNRQSGLSAVRDETTDVLIVSEAMHATAPDEMPRLVSAVAEELNAVWNITATSTILTPTTSRFEF